MPGGGLRFRSMRKLLRSIAPLLVALVLMAALAGVAEACPGCKESVGDTSAGGGPGGPTPGLPSGFNYSIYVRLAGLFSVLGLVTDVIVKGIRSADRSPPPPGGFPVR